MKVTSQLHDPGTFNPRERVPGTHYIGVWGVSQGWSGCLGEQKNLLLLPGKKKFFLMSFTSVDELFVNINRKHFCSEIFQNIMKFALKNLEPESLYFLQVQAFAQFGHERLKGEKAAIFLNTSEYKNGKL
jgi:hypothetical protein